MFVPVKASKVPEAIPVVESVRTPAASKSAPDSKTEIKQEATPAVAPSIGITLGSLKHIKDAARSRMLADQHKAEAIVMNEENLALAWSELTERIAGDKMVYKNALKSSKLLIEGEAIRIQADVVSIDFLKTERIHILDFFKLYYRNERINVLFEVALNDQERSGEMVMSAREIFDAMVERNPNLRILKDKLGLDMEY